MNTSPLTRKERIQLLAQMSATVLVGLMFSPESEDTPTLAIQEMAVDHAEGLLELIEREN